MTQQFKPLILALVFAVSLVTNVQAVLVEQQSNLVADGAITVAGGDNDRSDWVSLPSYQPDSTGDAPDIDFIGLQIAHDGTNIYFRLTFAAQTTAQFYGFKHNLYLDTDLDRATGFFGSGGFLSTGSDYLIQGGSYFSFAGAAQGDFTWNFLGGVVYDDFPTTDIEVAIPRSAIGNPDAFDILLNASSQAPEDYYPNGATGGATGDYFRYSLVAVPEPSPTLMLLLIGGCIGGYKKMKQSNLQE